MKKNLNVNSWECSGVLLTYMANECHSHYSCRQCIHREGEECRLDKIVKSVLDEFKNFLPSTYIPKNHVVRVNFLRLERDYKKTEEESPYLFE